MYYVKNWDTNQIISSHDTIEQAKRACRKLGYTNEDKFNTKYYTPVAFVVDDNDCCIYNPRFKKTL